MIYSEKFVCHQPQYSWVVNNKPFRWGSNRSRLCIFLTLSALRAVQRNIQNTCNQLTLAQCTCSRYNTSDLNAPNSTRLQAFKDMFKKVADTCEQQRKRKNSNDHQKQTHPACKVNDWALQKHNGCLAGLDSASQLRQPRITQASKWASKKVHKKGRHFLSLCTNNSCSKHVPIEQFNSFLSSAPPPWATAADSKKQKKPLKMRQWLYLSTAHHSPKQHPPMQFPSITWDLL